MTTKNPSLIGGGCIIASVCVGAGILSLPTAGAGAWSLWSVLIIALSMMMMTVSGWLLLEAFKKHDYNVSFHTVTRDLLGDNINFINNLAVYFVGGILLYAYVTSVGFLLAEMFDANNRLLSVLFVVIASSVVWYSTRAVDRISVVLIIIMLGTFIFGVTGLATNIDMSLLLNKVSSEIIPQTDYAKYSMALLPVALTSFGYHHSVASMRAYYKDETKSKYAILIGTAIALAFCLMWVLSIFGNLPRAEFAPIIAADGKVDVLLGALSNVIESKKVSTAISAFSSAAMVSSFIGVGLGVFDYLADLFNFKDDKNGRCKTWAVTFLPPLVLSLFFPLGFVLAIGYAGAVATIWTCFIPALLVLKARRRHASEEGFCVGGGNLWPYLLILFGILTVLFHVLDMLGILPKFLG